jgi:DNA/RNA endonuclease YhcR with UshA esterase domain
MRKTILLAAFSTITNILVAQTKLPVDSVSNHIGETVVVCSDVFGVKATETITFINVGAAYPNSPLTVVIFAKNLANFKDTPSSMYENKKICVTGVLIQYKGKTEIEVTKPEEIIIQ